MMVRHLWDGFLSLLDAIATLVICGIPEWLRISRSRLGLHRFECGSV